MPQNNEGLAVWGVDLYDMSNVVLSDLEGKITVTLCRNFCKLLKITGQDSHVLDDTSGAWKETRFPLCHGALAFWSGMAPGNGVLDRDKLNGFYFAFAADPDRPGAVTRGAIELDDLACVEPDEWSIPAPPDVFESKSVPGVHYATASAFASHTMKTDICDELCATEPACRFYAIENRWNAWDGTFPRCFL